MAIGFLKFINTMASKIVAPKSIFSLRNFPCWQNSYYFRKPSTNIFRSAFTKLKPYPYSIESPLLTLVYLSENSARRIWLRAIKVRVR